MLTLRRRTTPAFDAMPPRLVAQLGPLLDQARGDGPNGYELFELFDVLDDTGAHVYDLHLFCGDDGQLHRAGTLEHVASFSQGGPTGSADESLLAELAAALQRYRAAS